MDTIDLKTEKSATQYTCGVEITLKLIAGKWKSLILFRLLESGTLRFSELHRTLPGITQKMLTAQLRELEADKLLSRTVYPVVPPKTEYSLTQLGQSMRLLLEDMKLWGETYDQQNQNYFRVDSSLDS